MQKNIFTFSVPTKEDDNSKKIKYKLKCIDTIDLYKVNYQTLLTNYLKLRKINARNARENVNLLDLKMIDYVTDAKNVKKHVLSQKMD